VKKKRHCFLLSYFRIESEFFVTLLLNQSHAINTDILIIMSQTISKDESLGVVPETPVEEEDFTPPAYKSKKSTKSFFPSDFRNDLNVTSRFGNQE